MLIRSQDKKSLYNISTNKGLRISARAKGVVVVAKGFGNIGAYSTEEKAVKIMDMIQENVINFEGWKAGYLYGDSGSPVFEMPADEEVPE